MLDLSKHKMKMNKKSKKNFTLRADVLSHRLLGYLRISSPWQGSRTPPGRWPHVCSLFSFVLGGEKSPLNRWLTLSTSDVSKNSQALWPSIKKRLVNCIPLGQSVDFQEAYLHLLHLFTLITLQFHSLIWKNKSQEQSFCCRETLRKTLTAFFTVTFRIFRGHRCILNLPCILRTGVVLFRSPSHQPSTWDHSLQCRWLGESRPST